MAGESRPQDQARHLTLVSLSFTEGYEYMGPWSNSWYGPGLVFLPSLVGNTQECIHCRVTNDLLCVAAYGSGMTAARLLVHNGPIRRPLEMNT